MRVIVVDDAPLARDGVMARLSQISDVQVVADYGYGKQAVNAICDLRPDLVFLEVQLPDLSGFDVLQKTPAAKLPFVIFLPHTMSTRWKHSTSTLWITFSSPSMTFGSRGLRSALARRQEMSQPQKLSTTSANCFTSLTRRLRSQRTRPVLPSEPDAASRLFPWRMSIGSRLLVTTLHCTLVITPTCCARP